MQTFRPNSTGTPRFTFADPFGVGLKNRKDLFFMGDRFSLNHTPLYLLYLALCVIDKALYFNGFCPNN